MSYSRTTLHRPTTRTAPLTTAMHTALETIRAERQVFSSNGISAPTAAALAAAGEIVLVTSQHWGTTENRRSYSRGDWSAYPAPLPAAAGDAIRIVRWRELTALHLGCDCELTPGSELHAAYRAEQLTEAIAEAQRLATYAHPVHVCAKAPAGQVPAPAGRRSAAALAAEPRPDSPSAALARTLKRLGLVQGKGRDFRVTGRYNRHGERLATYALVLNRRAENLIAEHADRIETELALTSFPFRVSVRYTNSRPWTDVSNGPGERVRETAPPPPRRRPPSRTSLPVPAPPAGS